MLLESAETCGLDGTGIVQLCDSLFPLAQDLMYQQIDELESWRGDQYITGKRIKKTGAREFEEESTVEAAPFTRGISSTQIK